MLAKGKETERSAGRLAEQIGIPTLSNVYRGVVWTPPEKLLHGFDFGLRQLLVRKNRRHAMMHLMLV